MELRDLFSCSTTNPAENRTRRLTVAGWPRCGTLEKRAGTRFSELHAVRMRPKRFWARRNSAGLRMTGPAQVSEAESAIRQRGSDEWKNSGQQQGKYRSKRTKRNYRASTATW